MMTRIECPTATIALFGRGRLTAAALPTPGLRRAATRCCTTTLAATFAALPGCGAHRGRVAPWPSAPGTALCQPGGVATVTRSSLFSWTTVLPVVALVV